jgi:uracil-DNA glycosylase
MLLIKGLRVRGLTVPNIDPNDGGLNARALFLLETPGPMGVKFGFVSRDNPSPASRNMVSAFESAGLLRNQTLLWNVVPYYISTVDKNGNATNAQVLAAVPDTQAFIDGLPRLRVVVFCGRKAQRAMEHLRLPLGVVSLCTFHPGSQSYYHHREEIHETFRAVSRLLLA